MRTRPSASSHAVIAATARTSTSRSPSAAAIAGTSPGCTTATGNSITPHAAGSRAAIGPKNGSDHRPSRAVRMPGRNGTGPGWTTRARAVRRPRRVGLARPGSPPRRR
ncbi:hypothetical protein [Nannocystis pusilla]|uniref:hypothetical protein n=1 Tax=Nannocystis pusilla TaxID=889268 RepID=UPI003B7D0209